MEIQISQKRLGIVNMLIDPEDWDKIKHLNLQVNGYNRHTNYIKSVITKKGKYVKTIHIHRLIMGLGDYKYDKRVVNHIDGDGTNNRKRNLEICSNRQNSQSFNKINSNIGAVYFYEDRNRKKKWHANIVINKVRHHKRFLTKEEAMEHNYKLAEEAYAKQLKEKN